MLTYTTFYSDDNDLYISIQGSTPGVACMTCGKEVPLYSMREHLRSCVLTSNVAYH